MLDTERAIDGLDRVIVAATRAKIAIRAGVVDDEVPLYGTDSLLTDATQATEGLEDAVAPLQGQIWDRIVALDGVGVEG